MRKVGVHETATEGLLGGVQGRCGAIGQGGRQASYSAGSRTERLAPAFVPVGSPSRSTQRQTAQRHISGSWQTHGGAGGTRSVTARKCSLENRQRDLKKSQGLLRETPPLRFAFVHANRKSYPIAWTCRNLDVSKAGYFAWRRREQSERLKHDAQLVREIRRVHLESRQSYGSPRIRAELRAAGIGASRKRVARLMRIHGLKGKKRNKSKASSTSPGTMPAAANILNRQFLVKQPNSAWVSDITYLATAEGWLYLAVVIDLFSRRVIGWSMSKTNDCDLVLAALTMALMNRPSHRLIVHSDRGRQYTSKPYYDFLETHCITPSMSRKGDCWDNAVAESFFASIKIELKPQQTWRTRDEARAAIFEYIETWYNPRRRHSANAYLSPNAFEAGCVR
jgi:putative transposase